MKPTSVESGSESSGIGTKTRRGTLEDPEVLDNVPGHIIPILERELDDFETEATRFLDGESDADEFVPFRLRQGVYGQRQPDVHMVRVKLPFGGVNPDQMEKLADVAERYAPLGKGHITTRENFQFHHVPLSDAAAVLRELGAVGLSSREACGNTVRNVTGDPWAGVAEGELFDPTPYAGAFVRYFVRHDLTQILPRKFKVTFTSTDEDVSVTGIHDLGFIPRIRQRNGVPERGFEIRTGGGTSIMARVAGTLYDFVPVDQYLKVSEAVLRVFDRADELRRNRMRARIKFLIDRVGIEAFREMVDEELAGGWTDGRDWRPEPLLFRHDEEASAPPPPANPVRPESERPDFDRFVESNVRPQRQSGFSTVQVQVPRGDLVPGQFRGLASIMREMTGGSARTSIQQNVVLRWVRDESIYEVWLRLSELGLAEAGAHEITDIVSCPSTDSCKLGITSAMGLNGAVTERLRGMALDDPLARRIHIKMSGCPNGCGQHHIGNIGFYGAAIKVGDRQLPAYIVLLGGQYDGGDCRIGDHLKARLPAKRVPDAVERIVRFYQERRQDGEEFNAFVARVGLGEFQALISDLALPPQFDIEHMNEFIDWERKEPFQVIRGEGECAI